MQYSHVSDFYQQLSPLPRTLTICIKWGYEYSSHLNTGLVWYSNGRFVAGCRMVRYSNCGLKPGLKKACLWFKMFQLK